MVDVFPIPKQTRPWRCSFNNPTCTKQTMCRRCIGKRSQGKGKRKQRMVRKQLVPDPRWWGEAANEENWRGMFRLEVKAGKQIQTIATKYLAGEDQSFLAKAFGDLRPFAFVVMPDGWGSEGLVVTRLSVFRSLCAAVQPEEAPQPSHHPSNTPQPDDVGSAPT